MSTRPVSIPLSINYSIETAARILSIPSHNRAAIVALCLGITYATEGRVSIVDEEHAKDEMRLTKNRTAIDVPLCLESAIDTAAKQSGIENDFRAVTFLLYLGLRAVITNKAAPGDLLTARADADSYLGTKEPSAAALPPAAEAKKPAPEAPKPAASKTDPSVTKKLLDVVFSGTTACNSRPNPISNLLHGYFCPKCAALVEITHGDFLSLKKRGAKPACEAHGGYKHLLAPAA